ncbi:MAG: hypothetical protein IJU50_05880 [Lachnospiraceae bacterium]|nr:hypothetical protein [Lachnospiraceae bacterium]
MFSYLATVRYSECDDGGRLGWGSLMNLFQDASAFQSEHLGVGLDFLAEQKRGWVVNFWDVFVNEFPKMGEEVVVSTIPYEIGGFFGKRNFTMRKAPEQASRGDTEAIRFPSTDLNATDYRAIHDGQSFAYANSLWTFIDMETFHPARVTEPWLSAYEVSEKVPMEYGNRKITVPEELSPLSPVTIRPHHLDTNHHMNNAQYILIALDAIEEHKEELEKSEKSTAKLLSEKKIRRLRAEYRKGVYLGDTLYPKIYMDQEKALISLQDLENKPYAVIEFT